MTTQDRIRILEERYDADRDLCGPDCPLLRYPEYSLLQIVKEQQERIERLERLLIQVLRHQRERGEEVLG